MGFAGVYRAVYGYSASGEQELSLKENDLLYLLETADDGWWTVKKRVPGAASEEPQGIVPHNYIEPAVPEKNAVRALYAYDRQTDEELSFTEGTVFNVYATDGDWVLVGVQGGNDFGFVPKNYIETISSAPPQAAAPAASPASSPAATAFPPAPVAAVPSTTLAHGQGHSQSYSRSSDLSTDITTDENAPPRPSRPARPQRPTREALDRDLPEEPYSSSRGPIRDSSGDSSRSNREEQQKHLTWPVTDISGRRRIAKTLVVASTYITLINDDGGGKTQKWDVHDIKSYNSEKKHVFLDLENPTVSLELKASSQSEADRIISTLGQIVGARRGGGLDEVLAAAKSSGLKQGQIVLDFRAANTRELSVTEFETVFVLNDSDKDWWLVRNVSGKEGLVPRKFVHLDRKDARLSDFFKNKRQKERQRERDLEKDQEQARRSAHDISRTRSNSSVSRQRSTRNDIGMSRQRSTRSDRSSKSMPDSRKLRLWVDRTGTFRVDAQLLGCSDGKVHLHKANGVKIAVPASKLSLKDVEYVESVTGVNLSEDKPLDDPPSSTYSRSRNLKSEASSRRDATNARDDGWLSFFLECGVDPQNANRYAKNFTRDNMDESNLGDINASVLRTLGLREGDILRVTKKINEKLGRVQNPEGGLYSTNGGALQNNTGTTPADVDNKVWSNQSKSPEAQPQPQSQPQQQQQQQLQQPQQTGLQQALQPQPTAPGAPLNPQLTQAPTGNLADLLGTSQVGQSQPQQQLPALTGAITGPSPALLQAQKTAEAQLAAQQRQTQHQILRQQAELQKEQIRLLKEQQEQLRRQQDELVQIQKTGSQLQALGPFATGVAQQSSFAPSAASVLSAPAPPVSRAFQPAQNLSMQTSIQTGMAPNTTFGQPFGQAPQQSHPTGGFVPSTTGTMGLPSQPTGPFAQQQQQQQSHITGPFVQQRTGPMVQSQPTGPFAGISQQQTTGSFATVPSTPQPQPQPSQQQPTGGFQQQRTGPFTSFSTGQPNVAPPTSQFGGLTLTGQRTGPFAQPQPQPQPAQNSQFSSQQQLLNRISAAAQGQTTGPLQSQTTGPFQSQTTGPFQSQTTGPFQSQTTGPFQSQTTGPFQSQTTGPFQSQITGPFQSVAPFQSQLSSFPTQPSVQQPMTTFGNQFQFSQQRTGPFAQPQQTVQQPSQAGGMSSMAFGSAGGIQPNGFQQQATGPFQQQQQQQQPFFAQPQQTGPFTQTQQPMAFPQSTFGQATVPQQQVNQPMMQQAAQTPLQSQATGFGFGNQPPQLSQQQQQQPVRANYNMASASNPFGL